MSDSLWPHEPQQSQASLSITNSRSLLKLLSIELVMPSNHLILYHPLLLLPSIFPNIRVFSNESALCIRWPKYWSVSFSISPSNEHPGLISFKMDWLDLLAVQGTLKSLLQHHSSKQFSCLTTSNLPWFVDLTLQVLLFFTASDFTSITSHIHNWVLLLLWLHPFIFSGVISPLVESSDKTWCTGEEHGNPLQYSCLENPMNSVKRQKDRTLKDDRCPICYWRSVEK